MVHPVTVGQKCLFALRAEEFIPGKEPFRERLLRPADEFLDPADLFPVLVIAGIGEGERMAGSMSPCRRNRGTRAITAVPRLTLVHPVAGEEFVAAVAGEGDLDVPGGLAGDHIGGHGGGIAERLVEGGTGRRESCR